MGRPAFTGYAECSGDLQHALPHPAAAPLVAVSPLVVDSSDGAARLTVCGASTAVMDAVSHAGGIPVIPRSCATLQDAEAAIEPVDALILTGGHDVGLPGQPFREQCVDPGRDVSDTLLLGVARARRVPVLGICRGMQLLAATAGGRLGEVTGHEGHAREAVRHRIEIADGSRLAGMIGVSATVPTLHRYAVVHPGAYRAVATARSGVIEAIEHPRNWEVGVQWHPESHPGPETAALFAALMAAAFAGRVRRRDRASVA